MVNEDGVIGGLVGFIGGIILGTAISFLTEPTEIHNTKIFERENKPAVMRVYKMGADGLMVYDAKIGEYISEAQYLKRINNQADREIEEIEIKRTAGFYE